jgi:hypothetical protein
MPAEPPDAPPEEADGEESPETVDVAQDAAPRASATAEDTRRLLGSIQITRGEGGSMRIDAPPEAAATLAAMFETMARMLRGL